MIRKIFHSHRLVPWLCIAIFTCGTLGLLLHAQQVNRPREYFAALNGLRFADQMPGTGANAIAFALTDIGQPTGSGGIIIGPGVTGAGYGGIVQTNATVPVLDLRNNAWSLGGKTAGANTMASWFSTTDSITNTPNGLNIGTGTEITQHLSAVANLDYDFSAGGITCQDLNIPVVGAAEGDTVTVGIPTAAGSDVGVQWDAWVSAPGVVTLRGCDVTAAGGNVAAVNVRADVWKH